MEWSNIQSNAQQSGVLPCGTSSFAQMRFGFDKNYSHRSPPGSSSPAQQKDFEAAEVRPLVLEASPALASCWRLFAVKSEWINKREGAVEPSTFVPGEVGSWTGGSRRRSCVSSPAVLTGHHFSLFHICTLQMRAKEAMPLKLLRHSWVTHIQAISFISSHPKPTLRWAIEEGI